MEITATVTLVVAGGDVAPGEVTELNEAEARSLIERGFAREYKDPAASRSKSAKPALDAAADAILAHNVDQIVEILPDLGDGKLVELREREEGGKGRTTLVDAIKAEISGRAEGEG
ncbi:MULTISPECIES: hypothetical protein [unclassified Thioalkalivibrio]|uniref:hypothetical protein n=1 Tax=unclassified Thioalkalivibrio TaxID=2621013 RepID=UPI0003AA63A3|nr:MULTISPECIES: hypothetical protein [unclassified Thioalkalivibrio]